ncbi:MAG: DUF2179 domain-containing protein [candidate division KSB1 bacterium]|nr:DUF2179 domain-containing protein [candidate division KSB1 bacterium]MDZ7273386.1 DUF2179 domain-containing protein [candidate division KSB1 bacterium]MDZ7288048.1 DUF2179 domain-containing protein [candidate division KSB1 bacterium]MDZ7300100.1 DUF2179 domain-containing protein [candidate division KSB1 bacterium]MDZ7307224.1 DUF2179 domain-containing protein [candidate division KSB1 bacterium]
MDSAAVLQSELFQWVILPALIFSARVVDVSIGTLRIMFLARSRRVLAPILGFFEVMIWLLAISQIFKHLDNFMCYLAYGGGFAMGSFVGIYIEDKLALGMQVVRIITRKDASALIAHLKEAGYGLTVLNGEGVTGPVKVIFTVIQRKRLPELSEIIQRFNPGAFISIEDVRLAAEARFPPYPEEKTVLNRNAAVKKT